MDELKKNSEHSSSSTEVTGEDLVLNYLEIKRFLRSYLPEKDYSELLLCFQREFFGKHCQSKIKEK